LELVDRLEERHRDQTRRDGGHGKDTEELVRNDTKRVERREEVPLRKNFKRGGERVRRFTERGRFHDGEADAARDGAEDDDRENVKQIVRPRRFTVVVVAHALGELGAEHRVGEVRLLGDGRDDLEVTPSLRGDAAGEKHKINTSVRVRKPSHPISRTRTSSPRFVDDDDDDGTGSDGKRRESTG